MNIKKENIERIVLNIGILLLLFIILNILTTTVFQIVNIAMSSANITVSSILTIGIFLLLNRKRINKKNCYLYIGSIVITLLIFIIGSMYMGKIYDYSCDGNFYHKTAIGVIKEGWNPLYENSADFCKEINSEIEDKGQFLWVDHYPKATWNFAASIYSITNNIESGKVITLLLMCSIMCITYAYLSNRFLKSWQAILIAIVLAFNPIVISQIFTYYVDGIMGLLIYGIILFLIMLTDKKFTLLSDCEKWLLLASEIILCMNIKFTGVYFAAIFSIIFYLFWLIKSYKDKNLKEDIMKFTTKFAIIVVIGLIVVGGSTYLKNTIDHINPLYPLIGEGKVDIVTTMQPQSFGTKNRFVKLFESIFSKSENITYPSGDSPELKIPFSITEDEINTLGIPDTRIGGYGVLFSGILIVSIILIIYSLIKIFKDNKILFKYIIAILIGIGITTLFMGEAWWARYSPQLYLIPIIAIFSMFYISNTHKKIFNKVIQNIFACIIIGLLLVNVMFFMYWRYKDLDNNRTIKMSMENLKTLSINNEVEISFNETYYGGILYNLRDYGIRYHLVDEKESKDNYAYNYQILY